MPTVHTGRYLCPGLLAREVVPVRVSMRPPTALVPLPYEVEETAYSLVPKPWMRGEWPWLSPTYWLFLDEQGVGTVIDELAVIGERHEGQDLCLLDHEDVVKGHRSLRLVAGEWLETRAGLEVLEVGDDGGTLHRSSLPTRTRPKRPKDPTEDRRWTNDVVRDWPLTQADVAEWIEGRHWQTARSRDHAYTRRDWGDETMFLRVVLHVRQHGEQETFAGDIYTYLVLGNWKFWTMGADMESTVILNRREVDPDEGVEATDESGQATTPALDLFGKGE
jgi:hypothetical protein